jgi:hypothetical protein
MLLLYQFASFAEHRILSAFLLFGAMLSLAAPGRLGPVIAAGLVISSAVSVRTAMTGFEAAWRDRFRWAEGELSETERAVRGAVAYRPDASRWCNTLLTSQYPPSLIAVPAGIGLSVVRNQDLLRVPPRSHYLLLDDAFLATSPAPLDVDPIATLPSGTLYVNRESGCD